MRDANRTVLCGFAGYGFLVAAQDVALRQMKREWDDSDEAGA